MVGRDGKIPNYFLSVCSCCFCGGGGLFLFVFFIFCRGGLSIGTDLVFWPGLRDSFVSQNPRKFHASHSLRQTLVCAYTLWLNFNLLHNSLWITFPTLSYLVLYSYVLGCSIQLLYDWPFYRFPSHDLHFFSCCVLTIFALIKSVLLLLKRISFSLKLSFF